MNKHTPGPWHVVNLGKHHNNPEIDNLRIKMYGFDVAWSPDDECVCEHVYKESDARLIAAAPEMKDELIECLKVLIEHQKQDLNEYGHDFYLDKSIVPTIARINSLLAKIEG